MIPTGCPETSVTYYHYTLYNIEEERRSTMQQKPKMRLVGASV